VSGRRLRTSGLVLVLALGLAVAPPVRAASVATLDCSRAANGTGQVGVLMPARGTATNDYVSRFWTKFDASFGPSYDWRLFERWHYGDALASYVHNATTGQWTLLPANSWAFWDNWNTGTVHVWEQQYYASSGTWQGFSLGSCVVWQFFVFVPFAG